ncbi:MAG: hypothetical protein IT373_36115 [Polyangiaceae bacterium]|nr:hypothetical protein [Polyangiaceae bacterium]
MRFMSVYKPEKKAPPTGPAPDHMAEMGKFMAEMIESGTLLSTGALSGNRAAVRYEDGQHTVIDGPFAESKELVAGFALLRYASKAEAVEGVKRFLAVAGDGEAEVRELFDTEDFPVDPAEQPGGWRENEEKFRAAAGARKSPMLPPAPPGKQRFMALIKADKNTESNAMPSEAVLTEMGALMEEYTRAGKILGGEGLKPSARGARVRLSEGKFTVTDGPFAESKELIAGFSTLEVGSKEEAVEFAKRMIEIHVRHSDVRRGEVEVLQVM